MGYGFNNEPTTETHYVAHVKVERVVRRTQTSSDRSVSVDREVTELTSFFGHYADLEKLLKKVSAHLALVEE